MEKENKPLNINLNEKEIEEDVNQAVNEHEYSDLRDISEFIEKVDSLLKRNV